MDSLICSIYSLIMYATLLVIVSAAAAAKSLQLCLTVCDSMDSSPPGSSVHGILQTRILEWVSIPSPELTLLLLL